MKHVMRNKIFLIVWSLVYVLSARAGETTFDGLLQLFEQAATAETRLSVANQFMQFLYEDQFLDEPVHFTADTPADSLRQQVYYWAGERFYDEQRYQEGIGYALQALPLYHGGAEADCLNLLAISYTRLGDHSHAAEYAERCYELDLQSGDPDRISSSLNTLAGIYMGANLPEEAESYVLKGIEACAKTDNKSRMAVLKSTASEVYHSLDQQEKALRYAREACDIDRALGFTDRVAIRQTQMAAALIGMQRLKEAKACLQEAMPVLQASGNYHSLGIACNKMGELMYHDDNMAEAARYFGQGAKIFEAMGDPYNEVHSQLGLYNALKDSLPDKAKLHIYRYNALKDTIYSRETADKMSRYHAKLNNAELQAETDHHRSIARIILMVSLLVIGVLVVVSLLLYRRTRRFVRQFNQLSSDINQMPTKVAHQMQTDGTQTGSDRKVPLKAHDVQFLEQVDAIVNRQIEHGHVDVTAIAGEMCMSVSAFRRRFTSLVEDVPQAYIMRIRMEKACRLFAEQPDLTVAEVGQQCGFDDKSNFTRAFKRYYGQTPSEYVKARSEQL